MGAVRRQADGLRLGHRDTGHRRDADGKVVPLAILAATHAKERGKDGEDQTAQDRAEPARRAGAAGGEVGQRGAVF